MSTLLHFAPPFSLLKRPPPASSLLSPPRPALRPARRRGSSSSAAGAGGGPIRAHKVVVEHEGRATELEVEPDETILSKAIDSGLAVPHDCKLGVCMTCPARLVSGSVDQSEGMLSDDVVERGYTLLCVSYPTSDCTIKTIPEEELLSLQLATAND
ncbi:ferredoxin C 1, chloroplastic [Eucalyptus grandis]|uniref:Ferredoxin n=1 Tax=Eucalyptus globulus TaxID=34317 RepID=A0ABD3JGM6_EUCGL|nr:ferredoxin C 1, chloroplastic [Eucalyptus grandis]